MRQHASGAAVLLSVVRWEAFAGCDVRVVSVSRARVKGDPGRSFGWFRGCLVCWFWFVCFVWLLACLIVGVSLLTFIGFAPLSFLYCANFYTFRFVSVWFCFDLF